MAEQPITPVQPDKVSVNIEATTTPPPVVPKPNPVKALLMSRKVWLGVIGSVTAAIAYGRGLITAEQLVNVIVGLAATVIFTIGYEDAHS